MKKLFFTLISLCLMASAFGFTSVFTSGGINYEITSSSSPYTVSVAMNGSAEGNISIPASVVNNGITYAVTSLGDFAFDYCTGLTSVTIPSSVTTIGEYAFNNCYSLTTLTIYSTITSIKRVAFDGTCLANIYVYSATPHDIEADMFCEINKTNCVLHVPVGSTAAYQAAAEWKTFTNIVEDIPTTTFNTTATNLKINTSNGKAEISGLPQGTSVVVYNLQGAAIYNQKATAEGVSVTLPARGVYVITVGNESVKVVY